MRNKALTIVLLILIFIISGCSNNGNTKQLKEDSQLAPFNGEIMSYSREKSENPVHVSDEEWLHAKNRIKQEIDSSLSKLLSTLSLKDFYLISSMEGKLNNKSFNFDMYGYSNYFSVIVSKFGV